MSNKPLKLESGIYPKPVGTEIRLGDYGVWNKGQWNPKGNITDDFLTTFRTCSDNLDESVICMNGIRTKGLISGNCKTEFASVKGSISFHDKDSFLFTAHLTRTDRYPAIQGEIFKALEELYEKGKWDMDDWLAIQIYFSDNYCIMKSKTGGTDIELAGDLAIDGIDHSKGGFSAVFGKEKDSLTKDSYIGEESRFIGARFVSLTKKGLLSKELKLIYNEDSSLYELSDIDIPY